MANKDNQEDRHERLREFLKDNPQAWSDIKEEILVCNGNAINALSSMGCGRREYFAGKCGAFAEILNFEEQFKRRP